MSIRTLEKQCVYRFPDTLGDEWELMFNLVFAHLEGESEVVVVWQCSGLGSGAFSVDDTDITWQSLLYAWNHLYKVAYDAVELWNAVESGEKSANELDGIPVIPVQKLSTFTDKESRKDIDMPKIDGKEFSLSVRLVNDDDASEFVWDGKVIGSYGSMAYVEMRNSHFGVLRGRAQVLDGCAIEWIALYKYIQDWMILWMS